MDVQSFLIRRNLINHIDCDYQQSIVLHSFTLSEGDDDYSVGVHCSCLVLARSILATTHTGTKVKQTSYLMISTDIAGYRDKVSH